MLIKLVDKQKLFYGYVRIFRNVQHHQLVKIVYHLHLFLRQFLAKFLFHVVCIRQNLQLRTDHQLFQHLNVLIQSHVRFLVEPTPFLDAKNCKFNCNIMSISPLLLQQLYNLNNFLQLFLMQLTLHSVEVALYLQIVTIYMLSCPVTSSLAEMSN